MSKHKTLNNCKRSDEFIDYAIDHGATIRNGHGSHVVVCTDEGSCAIPRHGGGQELQIGLRHKIIKIFTLIGLAVIFIMIYRPEWITWFLNNI